MNNILNERKKIIQDILKMYCDGKGLTYISKYIYDNSLIKKINSVIDNFELNTILNKNSIVALAQIERVYINKYAPIDKTVLNFLFANQNSIDKIDFDEMTKDLQFIEIISSNDFKSKILRYNKLGLLNLTTEECVKIIEKYSTYVPTFEYRKKQSIISSEQNNTLNNNLRKLKKYKDIITELYDLYCKGETLEEISKRIVVNHEMFYNEINNNRELYGEFAYKLASYKYEMYLREKYINCLIIKDAKSFNEICESIYNNNQNMSFSRLCKKIDNYCELTPLKNSKIKEYLLLLKNKYNAFYENKCLENKDASKQLQYQKKIEEYEKIITDYIHSKELDITKYCNDNDVDIRLFNKALNALKKENNSVYTRYSLYISEYINAKNDKYLNIFYKVINYIRNGVENKYTTRKFDIVDYFQITSIEPLDLFNAIKDIIDIEDYICFINFISKNPMEQEFNDNQIDLIYSNRHILNAEFNLNGNLIKDSGRIVKLEEKQQAINELRELDIPINATTYNCMIKRIVKKNDKQLKLIKGGIIK